VKSVLNISAYRVVAIDDPEVLRQQMLDRARALGLLGTILLAHEGINLFLAGPAEAVRTFLAGLMTTRASPASRRRKAGRPPSRSASCWSRSSGRSSA
jgi:predicted sulfurtransferase